MHPSEWGLGGPVVLVPDSGGTSAQLLILLPSQTGLENSSQIVHMTWIDILKIIESLRISNLIRQSALALLTALSKAERHFCTEKENLELFLSWILQDVKRSLCSVIAHSNVIYIVHGTNRICKRLQLTLQPRRVRGWVYKTLWRLFVTGFRSSKSAMWLSRAGSVFGFRRTVLSHAYFNLRKW